MGVSNFNAKQVEEAHRELEKRGVPLVSNQVELSLCNQKALEDGTIDKVGGWKLQDARSIASRLSRFPPPPQPPPLVQAAGHHGAGAHSTGGRTGDGEIHGHEPNRRQGESPHTHAQRKH